MRRHPLSPARLGTIQAAADGQQGTIKAAPAALAIHTFAFDGLVALPEPEPVAAREPARPGKRSTCVVTATACKMQVL